MSEMINPYIAGAPVTEKTMFFGRQDVFDWVQRSLAGKFVDHILVIHGQRRVGKTSVLKQIPFHIPPTYIPVFFDLQGRTHTSLDRFLWRLAKEISRTLRTAEDISLSEFTREDFSKDPELFQNQLLPLLSQAIGDRRLLLIFDEFDSLEEPTAREMLTQDLIPYFSRLMHAPGPLAFIFCIGSSGRKLEHMQASYTDFFRIALYRKISFLEKEEAARLITQPAAGVIEYAPQAVEDIFHITSGHPYFTQLVCHELFGYCQKSGKRRIAREDVEAVLNDVVERGTVNLKFVWDDASDPERYVLAALSLAEDGRDAKSIHKFLEGQKVRISQREVGDSLRHLQEKDVLAPDSTFTVDLMRLWLLENKPLERVIEELIEVSPIATRYIEIAEEFRETGNQEEALDSYRRALRIDPQNLTAQVGIASLAHEQGDLPQAAEEYQTALEIDPEDIGARSGFCQAHLALGDQSRGEGQIEQALEHYRQVLTVNEQHMEARERLAAHQAQLGAQLRADERFAEAIEAFQRALEFTPDDPAITERLAETRAARRAKGLATLRDTGEEHFEAERWEQAITSFEEYLSLEPEDEEAVQAVEVRLAQAKEQDQLAEMYRQAQAALNEKRYDQAVSLSRDIINRDVSYRDATRLLAQAVELQRKARPMWKDIRVLGGAGGGIVVVIAALLLLRFLPGLTQAPTPYTPTPMPTQPPVPIPEGTQAPMPLSPIPMVPVRTLTGHGSPLRSVAFSPDGQTLASGGWDGKVVLWDAQTGQNVRHFGGTGMVHSMAFSPDSQTLATGSMESMVKLWRVADGTQIGGALEGGTDNVASVAFSPDGELLATSGWAEGVVLSRVSDGTRLRTMHGHVDDEPSVAFSPDGQTLAAGDWHGRVILWDVDNGLPLHTMGWHTREVWSVAFSPDGRTLASGSADETVILWDVQRGERLRTLRAHGGEVWSVAFSPDGQTLASGHEDTTVSLWDVETGQVLGTLAAHTSGVRSVAFSPDGRILASGSEDNTVMLWDLETVLTGPAATPPPPTPSAPLIFPARVLYGHGSTRVDTVTFSADGQALASGAQDKMVVLWDAESYQQLRTLEHTENLHSLAFSPDGQTLATASIWGTVKLWRVSDGTLLQTLEGDMGDQSTVAFSPDGETLAASGWSDGVQLWRVSDGSVLRILEDAHGEIAISPDGTRIAASLEPSDSDAPAVGLWRVSDATLLHTLHGDAEVSAVAFSPDGETLATGCGSDPIQMWSVSDGTLLDTFAHTGDSVGSVAFSPDGETLAADVRNGTIGLWSVSDGTLLSTLGQAGTGPVMSVAYSPDGQTLASGGSNGGVKLWDMEDATAAPAPTLRTPTPMPMGETLHVCGDDVCISEDGAESAPLLLAGTYGDFWGLPAWAPDGKRFVFSACDEDNIDVPACQGVYVADRRSSHVTALVPPSVSHAGVPSWSPDGEWIAYNDAGGLAIIRSDGTGKTSLGPEQTIPQGIAWAPDGQRIAWVAQGGCPNPDASCAVWVVDRDGSGASPIFESSDQALVQGSIAWSPDGKSVAVALHDGTPYLIDADCPSRPNGCDESSRTQMDSIPGHWMHNFYPQWVGQAVTATPAPVPLTPTPAPLSSMRSLMGHSDQVLGVASSPDRTVLASGSKHNTARLCRVSDGALPRILEGHTSGINSVAFSLDGASLASGSEAGRLLLWDVEQWVES